jgi:TBC1 domain family member 8/9
MAMISTQLRNFKEPTRDQLTEIFFSLPSRSSYGDETLTAEGAEKMEINAVLSLGVAGEEDSYVSNRFKPISRPPGFSLHGRVSEHHFGI